MDNNKKYAKLPHNNCNHEKHNIMKMQIEACKENSYIILYSYMYETDLNFKKIPADLPYIVIDDTRNHNVSLIENTLSLSFSFSFENTL